MIINYGKYLNGDEWPSESLAATVNQATGEYEPGLEAVYDMVPQKAVSALHKLVRWAHEQAIDVQGEEEWETRVRQSNLGRLLARKALKIEDFALYEEHGVDRKALSAKQLARRIAHTILDPHDGIADMDPDTAARLSGELATRLIDNGYIVMKETR